MHNHSGGPWTLLRLARYFRHDKLVNHATLEIAKLCLTLVLALDESGAWSVNPFRTGAGRASAKRLFCTTSYALRNANSDLKKKQNDLVTTGLVKRGKEWVTLVHGKVENTSLGN